MKNSLRIRQNNHEENICKLYRYFFICIFQTHTNEVTSCIIVGILCIIFICLTSNTQEDTFPIIIYSLSFSTLFSSTSLTTPFFVIAAIIIIFFTLFLLYFTLLFFFFFSLHPFKHFFF